ncbi:MAG: hypothetical protein VW496_05015 [Pelagibacteraceae bacterium]
MKGTDDMSRNNTGYYGWTNYETWLIEGWIKNDEDIYDDIYEKAKYFKCDPLYLSCYILERFSLMINDAIHTVNNPIITELVAAAIRAVCFREIAEHICEEVKYDEEIYKTLDTEDDICDTPDW